MAFDARIVTHTSSDSERLYYLEQHLCGEAKEVIGGCLYMDPNVGYNEARRLLQKEYGDPFMVSTAYINKVLSWPGIKYEDTSALKQLSIFLTKCQSAMSSNMSHMSVLNYAPNMQAIVQKLPNYLQNKWRDHVYKLKQRDPTCITSFSNLVTFVRQASESVNDPVFGKDALNKTNSNQFTGKSDKKSNAFMSNRNKGASFATGVDQMSTSQNSVKRACLCCDKLHDLDNCDNFARKTNDEKRKFLQEKRMCFACYGLYHTSKVCFRKRTCKKCGKKHPTAMHIDNFQVPRGASNNNSTEKRDMETQVCFAVNSFDTVVLHSILPVKVKQQDNDKCVETYALFDNGSSGCFISNELRGQLNAKGTETTLQLSTMHGVSYLETVAVQNLIVSDYNDCHPIELPKVYTKDEIPASHDQIPKPDIIKHFPHLEDIVEVLPEYNPNLKIGLLIGSNCPKALQPIKVVPTDGDGPFAALLEHGWTINGPVQVTMDSNNRIVCNRTCIQEIDSVKEVINSDGILKLFEMDFSEHYSKSIPNERGSSQEDLKFLKIANDGIKFEDGHYKLPLPFKDADVQFPNNRSQAISRANWQKKKMLKDSKYHQDYTKFVENIIQKGYAHKVSKENLENTNIGKVFYLPHHGVYHPTKKDKIRVVFDCSAKFDGVSLNDKLLQGPDLTNSLIGVLTRFREENIAFMGDIESMFYQVKVPTNQQDFLRFLWWTDGNLDKEPEEYQMAVHLFGATSSPSISNFALRKIAENCDNEMVSSTIKRNFYVDDCLKSVDTEENAKSLITDLKSSCAEGGFNLTKFTCNSSDVLKSIPVEYRSKEIQTRDLNYDNLPVEHALGIKWCAETDIFNFAVCLKDKPLTRRGILSVVCSIYDPLGLIAPYMLAAKLLLQDLCKDKELSWDDEISVDHKIRWKKWLNECPKLANISIQRCIKPPGFGNITSSQIHVFSDASQTGYGIAAYLRICNDNGDVHCTLLMGKSRVAPLKSCTIPRLELTAATVAVSIGQSLKNELDLEVDKVIYYTDSTTVLHYINNETKRFPIFVANRVQTIRNYSEPSQWNYVDTKDNPADDASRGLFGDPKHLRWFNGPGFIWQQESEWPNYDVKENEDFELEDNITAAVTAIQTSTNAVDKLIHHYSDWHRVKKAVAIYLRLKQILRQRKAQRVNSTHKYNLPFSVQDLEYAELEIIKYIQITEFNTEIKDLHSAKPDEDKRGRAKITVKNTSPIYRLDPFLDDGVLRVGGRLTKAMLSKETKHPVLLPYRHHVTSIIIRNVHERLAHAGRNHTLGEIREKFWIIKANSAVRHVISKCVRCRRFRTPVTEQKMADLPQDRVSPSPPFTFCGVDYFGPYIVKEGRKELKKYGVLFTCLVSRAIHLETANSLDTDSFILALRRFIARRGSVKEIRSDNGTNFRGAEKELRENLSKLNQDRVQNELLQKGINWKFNTPLASHQGGVWERQIRTVRNVLLSLSREFGERLDDESYRTLLCEVEGIVNSRPLTFISDDPNDLDPLTPSHLLTGKTSVIVPPPGQFQKNDLYMRKRWRKVQYLANIFWIRWKKEYLCTLQQRQKWNKPKRNMEIGDIVILKDDNLSRNNWIMGRVIKVVPDSNGYVRNVFVKTENSEFQRPVNKLVLLLADER